MCIDFYYKLSKFKEDITYNHETIEYNAINKLFFVFGVLKSK